MTKNPKPMHPGAVLSEIYTQEMGSNQTQLAKKCKCSHRKINEIVKGKRAVSPEYDLWVARGKAA